MADFYSALSGCLNPCCAPANTDGISIIICCENKQPCCVKGRHRRCCKGKKHR
jgi:hypothetical protein